MDFNLTCEVANATLKCIGNTVEAPPQLGLLAFFASAILIVLLVLLVAVYVLHFILPPLKQLVARVKARFPRVYGSG